MYQNPSQTQSWNPNGAPPQNTNWSQQPPGTPNGSSYAPRPGSQNQLPTLQSQAGQPGQPMQTLQPQQHPEQYRQLPQLPPPHQAQMYQPPYQQAPQLPYPPPQPAPRQRTAIACRYCRRRKIRCSGFDQNEDGRCTNCQRFSQDCVFTPVSAQTQAFVPAHTVWRGQNPPPNTQLYGAYGQPLPQHGNRDPYPPPGQPQQGPQGQSGQQQAGQYPPPPQGYHQSQMAYPGQQPPGDQKRGSDEPNTPTLPPPSGGGGPNAPRPSDAQQYAFGDPNAMIGPDGTPTTNGNVPNPMISPRPRSVVDAGVQTESPKASKTDTTA